ncbi:PREDICTED: glycine-rich cell wall structural protein 2-like [Priapulus caudatus]|uniref:Glycine-rich cell wall structural protein 2-like n=1 Tax=Priapulus caudatus TaxID=37621 RepID=A0ABM1F7T4_PRICU|nr:PREDICTED: glycine-rich cell wall structural protein 2-like [Priapulus caudatus]
MHVYIVVALSVIACAHAQVHGGYENAGLGGGYGNAGYGGGYGTTGYGGGYGNAGYGGGNGNIGYGGGNGNIGYGGGNGNIGYGSSRGYGQSRGNNYAPSSHGGYGQQGQGYTRHPEYFTTAHYGPIKSGRLEGSGKRTSGLSLSKQGKAYGSLYAKDVADAQETAAKKRGYEYNYREGHKYAQPKTLYKYSETGPIIGYEDAYEQHRPSYGTDQQSYEQPSYGGSNGYDNSYGSGGNDRYGYTGDSYGGNGGYGSSYGNNGNRH